MSQFPQAPPAGSYVPPPNDANESSQQPGYNSSPYQSSTPGYGAPQQSHKKGFGQMFDQAVTTGKPMLNKLGKTISSKLGSKQPAPSTPQYLESYQNYQQHYQHQQPQSQGFSPQQQQQQWQQPQQPQSAFANQPSPYPQSNPQSTYATPASGHSGQNNYFPQQHQSSNPQTPQQQQSNVPAYSHPQHAQGQGQNVGYQQQGEAGPPFNHGSFAQNNASGLAQGQGQVQQGQPAQGQFEGQQSGVVGTAQSPVQNGPVSPLQSNAAPIFSHNTGQEHFNQQQTWIPPTPGSDQASHPGFINSPAPHQQNNEPYNATPPPATSLQQLGTPPAIPVHPNQQQQHQQQHPYAQHQLAGTISDVPGHPDRQEQQQQWAPMSPATPHGQFVNQVPSTTSPPPPPTPNSQHQTAHVPSQPMQHQPTPPPQNTKPPPAGPTEFIAELPADFGNLNVTDGGQTERPPSGASQTTPYQAYQPPGQPGRAPSFTVARRAVSTSSLPLANPWRVADPTTELPTREFYILADLLFDALDRRCEPQNTGLLEASKILESWKAHGMAQEAVQLFQYDNYSAVGKLWALASIPHVLVPLQPSLTPSWNFQAQQNSQDLRIAEPAPSTAAYPAYFPAINRAGWYKHLLLEVVCESYSLQTLLSTFCGDTYKPAALNQPDLQKQDRAGLPALAARAHAVRNAALPRVCAETAQRLHSTPQPSHA